jgi:anaerobic selenocysteine-containing dehydrogenase
VPIREAQSFCRICAGLCGVDLKIDEQDRVIEVRGAKDHPLSQGYACIKGLQLPEAHNGPTRLLHPQKRLPDGSFVPIALEQALDEIADKLRVILERDGPESIAGFRGTQGYSTVAANQMLPDWLRTLGSPSFFSTMSIDQSAKWVNFERLGGWSAGRQPFADSDVLMMVGGNPLVSVSVFGFPMFDPTKQIKAARERGLKLIVIDPRRTESAHFADVFLQPYPGEDPTVAAGLLRIVLTEGWEDKTFCARYADNVDALRTAVLPFTPEYVERRAGVARHKLREAVELFARQSRRGTAITSTGPNMAAHSNLSEHLFECLNVVCGRFLRAGEPVPNPGVLQARRPYLEQVIAPQRSWERGHKSRIRGVGTLFGEMMSGILADEILLPGKGQIKSLFVDGGNPVNGFPDQNKTVAAFKALELLVTIDPYMTNTAKLSHFVLPPKIFFERADLASPVYETAVFPLPFMIYTPAVVKPPKDSDLVDDWYVFWALAKRLGRGIVYNGVALDMSNAPTTDELLAILARNSQIPLDEIKRHPLGKIFDVEPQLVEPGDPRTDAKFAVMPPDVAAEIAAIFAEPFDAGCSISNGQRFTHRLTSRRMRGVINTTYHALSESRRRHPFNPAYLHSDDLAALQLKEGDMVDIVSDHGRIPAMVKVDAALRPGVVSMTHGWGGMPGDVADYEKHGSSTNLLVSTERDCEAINAMPRMSAIPVNIVKASSQSI